MRHLHIGYGDSATACILEAIKDHRLTGDGAIPSRDDFTQGPISECMIPNGIHQRIEYWESVEKVLNFGRDVQTFYLKSIQLIKNIEADQLTIWVGDSCHDILATGWLLSFLEKKNFNWFIVKLQAVNLAMYTPNQLGELYKNRRALEHYDSLYFATTWQKTCSENNHYRIKKEDRIISVDEDYYDEYILSLVQDEFEPVSKVIGRILRDGKHSISDTTIEWNIKKMIDRKDIIFKGNLKSRNGYSICKS